MEKKQDKQPAGWVIVGLIALFILFVTIIILKNDNAS
jgi:hypothetical protein